VSKYNAKRTEVDGITFASKKEAARYGELKLLQRLNELSELQLQPQFHIVVRGDMCGKYIADFSYKDKAGKQIVEDVKGIKTPVYRLKKKLVEALYGIEIVEV
jgi:Protein of unknown function (DUF1064)